MTSRPVRCRHGRPLAIDGTACAQCESDRERCAVCGQRIADALLLLGVRVHVLCEPEDQGDEHRPGDPRSTPWWQR